MESSRTHFEVLGLGLEGQVLGFGLEASSPRKCPVHGSRTALFFELLKFCVALEKFFGKRFFCGDRLKNFCEDLFFLESTCACVLGSWPWPRAFLSLASRVSLLGKAVLGLKFFCVLVLESCVLDSISDKHFIYIFYKNYAKRFWQSSMPLSNHLIKYNKLLLFTKNKIKIN